MRIPRPRPSRILAHAALITLSAMACSGLRERSEPALELTGMGAYRATCSSSDPSATRWFAQGVTLYWGFNHREAETSLRRALESAPDLAIAHAYIALSLGPNINDSAPDPERNRAAHRAAQAAQALIDAGVTVTPRERGIIAAACARTPTADLAPDPFVPQRAYADALRALHAELPTDPEVACLFAESLLDLRPWDQWTKDGQPNEGTLEAIAAIEQALALSPDHPGANHLLIHAVEASPTPERAAAAADRLRDLVPGVAHLVHMPSHIDIRTGRYAQAIEANQRAIAADAEYSKRRALGGIYAMYRAHNFHFLVYAAMFEGRKELALEAVTGMERALPAQLVAELPDVLEAFLATRDHVLVRFGAWDEILAAALPPPSRPVTLATRHYARGVAYAATGRIDAAQAERIAFEQAYAAIPATAMVGTNRASVVLAIGRDVLLGEIAYRAGDFDSAYASLRSAVEKDDALQYDEPWSWMMPPRHPLGALLLERGHAQEALAVYRDDLKRHPTNGWALTGMARAFEDLGWKDEAAEVRRKLSDVFARKDVTIETSCYCATGAKTKN
jgi:tetratricopeptide (TPR) repeat protein